MKPKVNPSMCLGVPGQILETFRENDLLMGKVDFGGVARKVCLEHTPEAQVGDYVIVHVGFALSIVSPEEAQQVFTFLDRMNELEEFTTEGES